MKGRILFWICLLTLAVSAGILTWSFSWRVDAVTKVLNEHWNPYGHPPELVAKYPYKRTARKLVVYIWWHNPTEEELANHICDIEQHWKLLRQRERARTVARLLLVAYRGANGGQIDDPDK